MAPADLPPLPVAAAGVLLMGLGAFVQGAVGFGSALVVAPVLVLLDPTVVPGPLIAVSCVLAALLLFRDRSALSLDRVGWAVLGRVPGVLGGLVALHFLSGRGLRLAFGAVVLAAVTMSSVGPRLPVQRGTLAFAGLVSGIMGTVSSIGGPPMALLYQDQPGKSLRADLSAYFLAGTAMSLTGVAAVGRFGSREFAWTLVLVPGAVLGALLSSRGAALVDRGYTRNSVLAVSALSALLVIGRELLDG